MGAMVAILYSYDIFTLFGIKTKLYLFGVPPIGDKCFKFIYDKHLKNTTLIFNNKYDYIANPLMIAPYLKKYINYYHVGLKINNYNYKYSYPILSFFYPHFSYF